MKRAVAFLLCVLIFVAPVTTFVKADVVIGDNDDTIINENASILGRKLALMESLSDLALSGVTEFTISNTEDVDSYLDYLWGEIDNAINSLSDGTGFQEISDNLKSKYFTNLVQYKDYIINRGNYLAQLLPSGSPTTTLLSTFFANNIYGKQYTQHYDLALDMFRSLSAMTNEQPTPTPSPDFSFISNINGLYSGGFNVLTYNGKVYQYPWGEWFPLNPLNNYSVVGVDFVTNQNHLSSNTGNVSINNTYMPIMSIYVDVISENNISVRYVNTNRSPWITNPNNNSQIGQFQINGYDSTYNRLNVYSISNNFGTEYKQTSFNGLSTCLNYIYQHYANINLYVNNEPWALVDYNSSSPSLNIDGIIKIFGNDQPQKYQLQPNTKIDYDELYQVIYNAIRDNLPISQGDINYYDSHDTIYSPTIINNYGDEEGEESDLIDTILDYAVIPKFDTAIAQPMRAALTNGVVIMNNSITNVIPTEILIILGACFFLLLFAVVINRMIK